MRTLLTFSVCLLVQLTFGQNYIESYYKFSPIAKQEKKDPQEIYLQTTPSYNDYFLSSAKLKEVENDIDTIESKISAKTKLLIIELNNSGESSKASANYQKQIDSLKLELKKANENKQLQEEKSDSARGAYLLLKQGNKLSPLRHVFKPYSLGYAKVFNETFYGTYDLSALQSISLMADQNSASISTELLSDYIGLVRFGLYGSLSASDSATESDQIESIFNGGGQVSLLNTIPLLILSDKKQIASLSLTMNNRLSTDAIAIGNVSTNFKLNNYIYTDLRLKFATEKEAFSFVFDCNLGYIFGNNNFYSAIENRETWLSTLGLGINVQNKIQLKISGPAYSSSEKIQKQPYKISVLLSPKK